jgi:hypothetical protein
VDRKEAQLILSGLRPGGLEANEPYFAEALALVETDPELKSWWDAQQSFDRKIMAKLRQVPVPGHLRDNILAAPKIIPLYPSYLQHRTMLAVAAMVAILCVAAAFWHSAQFGPLDRADFTSQAISELGTNGPSLAIQSSDQAKLQEWLRSQNAPVGNMPGKVNTLPPIGCQKYMIHGHAVALVCLALANGGIAHFFTVEKSALNDPPGTNGPQFGKANGWNTATWSDNHMTYMLATQASADDLKQLFSSS